MLVALQRTTESGPGPSLVTLTQAEEEETALHRIQQKMSSVCKEQRSTTEWEDKVGLLCFYALGPLSGLEHRRLMLSNWKCVLSF